MNYISKETAEKALRMVCDQYGLTNKIIEDFFMKIQFIRDENLKNLKELNQVFKRAELHFENKPFSIDEFKKLLMDGNF